MKNPKTFLAAALCAGIALGTVPSGAAEAAQAPELSVVSALSGASSGAINEYGYLITARDPGSGAYLDVRYDVSSTNAPVFSNLDYSASQANGARGTQFESLTQFYVLASAYSNTTGLTTEKVFGPFSLDSSAPSITITSGMPNASTTYDSFTVSYLLDDTYSGIDLDKSSYSWSTSATTVGGYKYKFTSLSGSLTTPAGLSGTQYLHMNVMDKAGHTSTKVIGPINMSGNGSSISFSGIKTEGDMVSQSVTINVSTVGSGINFTRSYYEITQDGVAPVGNKVYLNSLVTPVMLTTRGNYTIHVYVVDNSGNVYTAVSPVVRVGQTVTSNVQVNYSPSYATTGSVTATIIAYDTDGSYVTPITQGVTKINNTTFQYVFTKNSDLTAEFRTARGTILQVPLSCNWINSPSSYFSVNHKTNGVSVVMNEPGTVDYSRSYYQVGNTLKYFNSPSTNITFSDYTVAQMKVVVYNKSGEKHERTETISYLPSGATANLTYSTKGNESTAYMSWSGLGAMTEYPRDWDSRYDNYSFTFEGNGYTTIKFRTRSGEEINFDLYVDWLRGNVNYVGNSSSNSSGRYSDELYANSVTVRAYDLNSQNPNLRLSTTRGNIDLDRSYFQIDGGSKQYFTSTNQTIRIGDWKYDIYVRVYNTNGDYVDGTFYANGSSSSSSVRGDELYANGVTVKAYDLDTRRPSLRLSTSSGAVDLDRSYYQIDGGSRQYFNSTNPTLNLNSNDYRIYVRVYNTRGDSVDGTFYAGTGSSSVGRSDRLSASSVVVNAYDLGTTRPNLRLSTDRGSIDLERSYFQVDNGVKRYFTSTNTSIDTGSYAYQIYVRVYNSLGDYVDGTFYSTQRSGALLSSDISLLNATTTRPTLKIVGDASIDFARSYFTVNAMPTKYSISSREQVLNLTGVGNYTLHVNVYTRSGELVTTTLTGNLGGTMTTPNTNMATAIKWSGTNKPKYLSGFPDGTIQPDAPVTRAQFYQMLNQNVVGGYGVNSTGSFVDLKAGSWYYNAVTRFIGMGIAPNAGTMFNPNEPLTRGEAAAILARLNLNPDVQSTATFTDVAGHKYQSEIYAAARKGLISGYTDGSFKPDYGIRRAEAVTMINNASGRVTKASSMIPTGVITPATWEVPSTHWAYYQLIDALNGHTTIGKSADGADVWGTVGAVAAN